MDVKLEHIAYAIIAIVIVYVLSGNGSKKEEPKGTSAAAKPTYAATTAAATTEKPVKAAAPVSKATTPAAIPTTKPADAPAPAPVPVKQPRVYTDDELAGPEVTKEKRSSKKSKAPSAPKKVVVIDEPKVQSDSDSDSDNDIIVKPETSVPNKAKNHDQEAVLGRSHSQDDFFEDTQWNEVKKAPKTKKEAKKAAKVAAEIKLPKEDGPAKFPQPSEHVTKVQEQAQLEKQKKAEEAAAAEAAKPETINKTIQIESKKVGAVVGAKGVTLKAIQEATECEIRILKDKDSTEEKEMVDVSIIGTDEKNVRLCVKSVQEVATKGYCLLLKGENFSEGSILLKSNVLGELFGKGGSTLKAIQDAFDVKLVTPQGNFDKTVIVDIKVGVVGDKKNVQKAKECIKNLTQFHHSDATHPGYIHEEINIDAAHHKYIIGTKGSEIHHIQKNFKVNVHIPNAQSVHEGVLVVGERVSVEKATAYMHKVVENALLSKEEREAERAAKPTFAEQREAEKVAAEEAEIEPWMKTYIKEPSSVTLDMDSFPGLQ